MNLLAEKDIPSIHLSGNVDGTVETVNTVEKSDSSAKDDDDSESKDEENPRKKVEESDDPEVLNTIAALCVDAPSDKVRNKLQSTNTHIFL